MDECIDRHFADYNFTFCLKHSVVISFIECVKTLRSLSFRDSWMV